MINITYQRYEMNEYKQKECRFVIVKNNGATFFLMKKRTKTLKMMRKNGQNKQKNIGKTDKNIVI